MLPEFANGVGLPVGFGIAITLWLCCVPALRWRALLPGALFTCAALATWASARGANSGQVAMAAVCTVGYSAFLMSKPTPRDIGIRAMGLLLLGLAICYLSSSKGGADGMIELLMSRFNLSHEAAVNVVEVFRKCVHFAYYGTIGGLAFSLVWRGGGARVALVMAVAATLIYATFDEMRQSTQPNRQGSAKDVLLDGIAGAAIAVQVRRRSRSYGESTGGEK